MVESSYIFKIHNGWFARFLSKMCQIGVLDLISRNFSDSQNPRFILECGFKSRVGYNGAHTVCEAIKTKQIYVLIVKVNILHTT